MEQAKGFLAHIDEDVARAPSAIDRVRRVSDHILQMEAKLNDMKFNKKLKDSAGVTQYDVNVKLRELKAARSTLLKEMQATAAQQENTRAPQEVTQQAGVPAEPQGRTGGREAAEAGAGDRVQRAAESGGQAKGAKKEGVKPARPAAKPAGKALTPAEVKAEFQRQIDAVPRFDDGGPETITLKAGGSTAKIQNTARRVAEYMKALDTVKGGKTPKPVSAKTDLNGSSWLGGAGKRAPLKSITDMIDDLDSQAAVDFAAAQGIDLEVALKDDRKRLDRVRNLKPTPEPQEVANEPPTAGSNFLEELYGDQPTASAERPKPFGKVPAKGQIEGSQLAEIYRKSVPFGTLFSYSALGKQKQKLAYELEKLGVPKAKAARIVQDAATMTPGDRGAMFLSLAEVRRAAESAGVLFAPK